MKFSKLIAFPTALALMAVLGFGALGAVNTANAQIAAPRVAIQLLSTGLTSPLVANSDDATVARLVLDTTGSTEAVRIASLPFILTASASADESDLNNCVVSNETDVNTALSNDMTMQAGLNNVGLNTPIVLAANTVTTLSLRCDVSSDLVAGSTYTFSMNTANVSAVGASTNVPALVIVRGAVVIPPVVVVPPVTPGLPTTGATGEAATHTAILLGSALMAVMGLGLIARSTRA